MLWLAGNSVYAIIRPEQPILPSNRPISSPRPLTISLGNHTIRGPSANTTCFLILLSTCWLVGWVGVTGHHLGAHLVGDPLH